MVELTVPSYKFGLQRLPASERPTTDESIQVMLQKALKLSLQTDRVSNVAGRNHFICLDFHRIKVPSQIGKSLYSPARFARPSRRADGPDYICLKGLLT